MKLKEGVNPQNIQPEIVLALMVAAEVYKLWGHELVVTSISDGKHSRGSKHYIGFAADIRSRYFTLEQAHKIAVQIWEALGKNRDYDIVVESDHIHIEYDPKGN